jgi:hypothetical protein
VNVLLTDYGEFGWGISSPQLPGFIGGRATQEELRQDLPELLSFAGVDTDQDDVRLHLERHLVLVNGEELTVRVATGEKDEDQRASVANTLVSALRVSSQVSQMLDVPRRPTGEVLFVCATPYDTIGWIIGQLENDDAACVVLQKAVHEIRTQSFTTGFVAAQAAVREHTHSVDEMGWDEKTTLQEILEAQSSGRLERGEQLVSA